MVNCRLKWSVELYNALHRFREVQGTGTAALEANLAQNLDGIAYNTLLQVFLDIHKVYDSLDRGLCLEVLREYGLGPKLARLLTNYW